MRGKPYDACSRGWAARLARQTRACVAVSRCARRHQAQPPHVSKGRPCATRSPRLHSAYTTGELGHAQRSQQSLDLVSQSARLRARRPRDQSSRATQAATARSRARGPPHSPLQPAHRGSLRGVDPTLHPVPPQAPPRGDGGTRDHSLLELACGRREGGRLHPEPGAERALLFLYRAVLELDLPWLDGVVRAKRPQRLPVVLTSEEVRAVLQLLEGVSRLMAHLLYGPGLRCSSVVAFESRTWTSGATRSWCVRARATRTE